jgi:hypothetical protein
MSFLYKYGSIVPGFDVRVVNEREARAAAGILFVLGFLSLTNAVMLGNIVVTKYFITFFTFDFIVRVISSEYSPSLLMGRFFVKNQIPEYVGAAQKRFAWGLGLLLALPMFYTLVIVPTMTPIKLIVCVICLILLFSESAFSICFGCMIYNLINKEKSKNCPGGVCELRKKDTIQMFSKYQKTILLISSILMIWGTYLYLFKIENKTHFGIKIGQMLMSKEEKKIKEDEKYERDLESFFKEEEEEDWTKEQKQCFFK